MPPNPHYDDPQGDLVLRSSDGFDARVRSIKLRGASEVFDAMLEVGAGSEQEKATESDLPLVKVDDEGDRLGRFLQFAITPQLDTEMLGSARPSSASRMASAADNSADEQTPAADLRILKLTDKYETPVVAALVVMLLLAHVEDKPATVFSLAAIHGHLTMARHALAEMSSGLKVADATESISGLSSLLSCVDRDIFVRIPPNTVYDYLQFANSALASFQAEGIIVK
jgi:hypothetical protein